MKHYIGIDLGGTNTKIGIVDSEGNLINSKIIKTHSHQNVDKTLERIWETAKKVILEKTPMYFHRIIQNSESHSQSYFDFNKHVCYIKSVNTLLQYTLTFHLYCLEFYMGAGKLLMSGILNSLIANKSMREFICRIRLLKSDAIFASIFHFYIIPQIDKWYIRFLKKIICHIFKIKYANKSCKIA